MSLTVKEEKKSVTSAAGAEAPRPKLCHLKKWSIEQGYGFHLCSNKSNLNMIGKIDFDSPAEATGLQKNDHIIEINYESIKNKSHYDIVALIRNGLKIDNCINKDEVLILVADNETKSYYDALNIEINSEMKNILKFETPFKSSIEPN